MAAIRHAASADKYLFVFFWKETSQQTSAMWGVFQSAMGKVGDRSEAAAVNLSDPAEKPMVAKFGLDRAPLPLVLALAPNGAITKGFPGKFTEHLLPEHVHRVSLSFLVDTMDKRRGGCAPNIAYTLALLGEQPLLMATAGDDFGGYRQWLDAAGGVVRRAL